MVEVLTREAVMHGPSKLSRILPKDSFDNMLLTGYKKQLEKEIKRRKGNCF
nr:hypothetical protein [Candidatus Njordarchaeum guaymaensis]